MSSSRSAHVGSFKVVRLSNPWLLLIALPLVLAVLLAIGAVLLGLWMVRAVVSAFLPARRPAAALSREDVPRKPTLSPDGTIEAEFRRIPG